MKFSISATCGDARSGRLVFKRGAVNTPAFMPVGTYGAVRAVSVEDLAELGAEMILANAFHLMLRPGEKLVEELGGLHEFGRWQGPILTDSGGFQAFSLAKGRGISEQGLELRSPIDGSPVHLDPEACMRIQACLGSDVHMVLDECTPYPVDQDQAPRVDVALDALGGALKGSVLCRRRRRSRFRHCAGRHVSRSSPRVSGTAGRTGFSGTRHRRPVGGRKRRVARRRA